uniref:Uncharacterized protein n=1 Tax=Arundo donax TaxID=35708 RepID=A0A0A9FEF9_ARUDO
MLLKRLKVLLQTAQENCVEPTRISAAEGIQYWPGVWLPHGVTVDGAAAGAAKLPAPPQEAWLLQGGAMEREMDTSGSCSWNKKLLLWLLLLLPPPPPPW